MQSANKMCVALLFGGMSSEHEVSCVSVGNFVRNIDRSKYEVLTVGITKEGRWLYTEATSAIFRDADGQQLVALAVELVHEGAGGHAADLVLAGHSAEQDDHTHFMFRIG